MWRYIPRPAGPPARRPAGPPARRHDVDDLEMQHAVEHAMATEDIRKDPDRWLVIGPDRAGNLLELLFSSTSAARS